MSPKLPGSIFSERTVTFLGQYFLCFSRDVEAHDLIIKAALNAEPSASLCFVVCFPSQSLVRGAAGCFPTVLTAF